MSDPHRIVDVTLEFNHAEYFLAAEGRRVRLTRETASRLVHDPEFAAIAAEDPEVEMFRKHLRIWLGMV